MLCGQFQNKIPERWYYHTKTLTTSNKIKSQQCYTVKRMTYTSLLLQLLRKQPGLIVALIFFAPDLTCISWEKYVFLIRQEDWLGYSAVDLCTLTDWTELFVLDVTQLSGFLSNTSPFSYFLPTFSRKLKIPQTSCWAAQIVGHTAKVAACQSPPALQWAVSLMAGSQRESQETPRGGKDRGRECSLYFCSSVSLAWKSRFI